MPELIYDKQNNLYYFVDENGKQSEPYADAKPYSQGYSVVQKEKGKGYYFRNKEGKLSQKFNFASSFDEFGFAIVCRTKNSKYQYIDTDLKLCEEEFYYADSYHEGFARVQYFRGELVYFRDTKGNISKDGYDEAHHYQEGFACVSERAAGNKRVNRFRDLNGNLSEPFAFACDYQNGLAVVGLIGEDIVCQTSRCRLIDKSGKISEDSYYHIDNSQHSITPPPTGFIKVKETANSPEKLRDYLGNVTDKPTQKGLDYYLYITDAKSVFDLDSSCFGDEKFLKTIMDREQNLLWQASTHCSSEEDMKKLAELADFTGEYIKAKAYEAHLLTQENANSQQMQAKLEREREALQDQIENMY